MEPAAQNSRIIFVDGNMTDLMLMNDPEARHRW
jgi:hypothetical protein